MKVNDQVIITQKEVLHLWGIKMPTLIFLEEMSHLSRNPDRNGYTMEELNILRNTLKKLTRDKMKK